MDCKKISKLIKDLAVNLPVYDGILGTRNIPKIQAVKAEIIMMEKEFLHLVEDIDEFIDFYDRFIRQGREMGLNNDEAFLRMIGIESFLRLGQKPSSYRFRRLGRKILEVAESWNVDHESLARVVSSMIQNFAIHGYGVRPFEVPTDLPDDFYNQFGYRYTHYGHDIRLNRTVYSSVCRDMSDGIFHIKGVSDRAEEGVHYDVSIGKHATGGFIHVDSARADAGTGLKGATIIVENLKYGSNLAESAESGTIFVKNFERFRDDLDHDEYSYGELMNSASDATVVIENVLGVRENVIDCGNKATLLIKGDPKSIKIRKYSTSEATVFVYDEAKDKYVFVAGKKIVDDNSMKRLMEFKDNRSGVYWIDRYGKVIEQALRYMKAGIAVVKKVPTEYQKIGLDLEGGVIILDDPDFSLEEARKRVVPEIDRKGGIIIYLRKWTEKGRFGLPRKRAEFVVL